MAESSGGRAGRIALAVMALGALCACVRTTGEPWSTKSRSVPAEPALPDAPDPGPPEAAAPMAERLRAQALEVLKSAAGSESGLLRANAIEALHHAPRELDPIVRAGLVDPNRGVRFVAAMTVGTLRLESLSHLLAPMLADESGSVRAAALFGLARCGGSVDLTPLADLVVSEDPEVRANAALVLGELGNPTALPLVRRAVGLGMERVGEARVKMVDLQLAEAMVKLGDEQAIEAIRAALFAPPDQGELTALACMLCGRLRDERAAPDLVRLARRSGRTQQPAEVRLAATWALAHIDPAQSPLEVPLAYLAAEPYQVRAQAALTLGQIGGPESLAALGPMLQDEHPMVRVAAAGAVVQITRAAGNQPSY